MLYANIDNTLHYVRTRTQNTQLATIQERLDLKQRTYWLVQWAPLDSILNEYRLSSSVELATFAYKLHTHTAHTQKASEKRRTQRNRNRNTKPVQQHTHGQTIRFGQNHDDHKPHSAINYF